MFLILTAVVWLFPETRVPPGTWLVGTGLLLLGLNAVRAISKVPVSGFGPSWASSPWPGASVLSGASACHWWP